MLNGKWTHIKRRLISYSYAYLGKYVIRSLLWSCKIKIEGMERFANHAEQEKCILMLWHNRLAIVAEVLHNHAPNLSIRLSSDNSRDGDPLAIMAESYKSGRTIRVPHNARHQALKKVIDNLKYNHEVIVITPDGPRGPRYEVKPGTAMAAIESSAAIIPFTWTADRYWELKTWDRMRLPKPFSKINVVFGEPMKVDRESAKDLQLLQTKLQDSLLELS